MLGLCILFEANKYHRSNALKRFIKYRVGINSCINPLNLFDLLFHLKVLSMSLKFLKYVTKFTNIIVLQSHIFPISIHDMVNYKLVTLTSLTARPTSKLSATIGTSKMKIEINAIEVPG